MYVSVIFVRVVLAELQRQGVAPSRALDGTGIHQSALSDVGSRIALEQLERLLAQAASLSGDPAFGLRLGQHVPGIALQVLSFVLLSSPTLRLAIDRLLEHAPHVTGGVHWELRERGSMAYLSYREVLASSAGTQVAADAVLAVAARVLRRFTQRGPAEVWFRHRMPSYHAEYDAHFRCPICFGENSNTIVFARELLDMGQPYGDPNTLGIMHEAAVRLFDQRSEVVRLSDRVRMLLRDEEIRSPDQQRLARRLGMSQRSFRRKLAEEGVSLTALLDEARFRYACEALRARRCRIRDMSERLGYSEPSSFHRAFKRWTGKTPRQFILENGSSPSVPLDGVGANCACSSRTASASGAR